MKKIIKTHIFDFIVCIILILGACSPFIAKCFEKDSGDLIATIQVQNEVVQVVDLSKENEEREFVIKGTKGDVKIGVKHNAIAILESNCPNRICIHTGYVDEVGKPIVCTHNMVLITIEGDAQDVDVEVI